MSRLPVRARLTAAFALALVLVLGVSGLFVYTWTKASLDDGVDDGLRARADALAAQSRPDAASAAGDPEERFVQLLDERGAVIATSGPREGALTGGEPARARRGELLLDRRIDGIEGTARLLARPAPAAPEASILVVGESLEDRDEALAGLVTSFALGGALAVALASLAGYALATAALRPVERMRRRAAALSVDGTERLPLPAARDEIARLGETLNEMIDRLRRSYERERRFVADASHELRTPVAVVKTELEGALRADGDAPARESLVAALEECDRLAQLAEDLLTMARAEEGALPLRPEHASAREVLDRVAARFRDRAGASGRSIHVDADDGVTVWCDPLHVRQAVGNLVDNALRHGAGQVTLCARAVGAGTELSVVDEGPGFSPALAERAFERFTRGGEARTRGGAGLGLAIVRAIADAHGGRAAIVAGARTTVAVWLPGPGASLIAGSAGRATVAATARDRQEDDDDGTVEELGDRARGDLRAGRRRRGARRGVRR